MRAPRHLMVTLSGGSIPSIRASTNSRTDRHPFVVDAAYTLHIADPSGLARMSTERAAVRDRRGVPPVDMLLWYGLPDRILADMSINARPDRNYDAEDTALIHFSYDSGLYGSLLLSRFIGPKTEQIRLVGSKGIVHLERGRIQRLTNDGEVVESLAREQAWPSAAVSQVNHFCRVVEGLRPNVSGPRENLAHLSFIQGCYESARTRTTNPKGCSEGARRQRWSPITEPGPISPGRRSRTPLGEYRPAGDSVPSTTAQALSPKLEDALKTTSGAPCGTHQLRTIHSAYAAAYVDRGR